MGDFNIKELLNKLPPHLIIIGVLGLALVIIGNPFDGVNDEDEEPAEEIEIINDEQEKTIERNTEEQRFKKQLEQELENLLSRVSGSGQVKVMINLKSGAELDIAKNVNEEKVKTQEMDGGDGERMIEESFSSKEILTIREQGDEKPLVLRELKPQIAGIVIVSEGGQDLQVQKQLKEAAETLFNISRHRIQVLPMKPK